MHDMENEPLDNRVPIIERHKEIDLIQSCINRMAQNSFQVKGWTVALFAVILALLPEKVESTNKFFLGVVMLAVSVMFWYLDSFFLAAERNGPVDKSKKTAETHRGPSRIINLGIAKDGILPSA